MFLFALHTIATVKLTTISVLHAIVPLSPAGNV
jgi:hypothetical protein